MGYFESKEMIITDKEEDRRFFTLEMMAGQHEMEVNRRKRLMIFQEESLSSCEDIQDAVEIPNEELDALASLGDMTSIPLERFESIEFNTYGYVARDGHVTGLGLFYQGLRSIPDIILQFHFLEELRLGENEIETLPDSIVKLERLEVIDLSYNRLKGLTRVVKDWLDTLKSVKYLPQRK